MHVLVAGKMKFVEDTVAECLLTAQDYIAASRHEEGCISYDWTMDPAEPRAMHVFEEWDSEETFGKHLRNPAYYDMRAHLKKYNMEAYFAYIYGASVIDDIYPSDGSPRVEVFGVPILEAGREDEELSSHASYGLPHERDA